MAYTHYFPLTVNDSLVTGTPGANFRTLIVKTHNDLRSVGNGGLVAQADGGDISLFADDGTTQLPFELISYNPATGAVVGWGLISCADGLVLRLYVGDSGIVNQSDPTAVYDHPMLHLEDGTMLSVADSSAIVSPSNSGAAATAGLIGSGAADLDGSSDKIVVNNGPIVAGLANWTVACWVRTSAAGNFAGGKSIYSERAASGDDILKVDSMDTAGTPNGVFITYRNDAGTLTQVRVANVINDDVRHMIHAILTAGTFELYLDGAIIHSQSRGGDDSLTDSGIEAWCGADKGDAGANFPGIIDELRVIPAALNGDIIATEFANQDDPDSFWSLGAAIAAAAAAVTGTATAAITESEIVAGSKTIVITLSGGAQFIPA